MDLYSHLMEDTRISEMEKLNGVFLGKRTGNSS